MTLLHRWRYPLLIIVFLLGVLLLPGLQRALNIDNSLTAWFIEGDPALEPYYRLQENFGNDEMVILVLESAPENNLLQREQQQKLKQLALALSADSSIERVVHPILWEQPRALAFGPATPLIPPNEERARQTLEENTFLKNQFYSRHYQASRLFIKPQKSEDFEKHRAEIIQNIYQICDRHWSAHASHFGGLGVIYEALNELSAHDFSLFLGLGYILMFALIALLYRHWAFTFYALVVVALSSYFTLAIYGSFGFRLNLLSTLIPTIIILLGVMDVMHILNEFRKAHPNDGSRERALKALNRIWKPCLFTSLSTMAGFLSLSLSPVAVLAEFGLFAALGIALALFFSFLGGVLLLPASPLPAQNDRTSAGLGRLQDWVLAHSQAIWLITGLALMAAIISIPKLKVDTDSIAYLPQDHPVRKQSERIEALFGPYMPLDYLVLSESKKIGDLEVQQSLMRLDEALVDLEHIGSMTGYHDLIAALSRRGISAKNTPWSESESLPFYLQSFHLQNPEIRKSFLNTENNIGRFYLSGELISARALQTTLTKVDSIAESLLGPEIKIIPAGYQSLYANIVNYLTESQVRSIILAGFLIFILLWIFLGSFKLSLISLIPNFFPVFMLLGTMVWFDIALDTATASIASIVLSFSIDDTMHFIWHYRKERQSGQSAAIARKKTMTHVGRAIVFTSLVLFLGYALMWFGSLKTVIYFGTLTASSIVAALISQLFIFPLLLAKWDS